MAIHGSDQFRNLKRLTRSGVAVHVVTDGSIILYYLYALSECPSMRTSRLRRCASETRSVEWPSIGDLLGDMRHEDLEVRS